MSVRHDPCTVLASSTRYELGRPNLPPHHGAHHSPFRTEVRATQTQKGTTLRGNDHYPNAAYNSGSFVLCANSEPNLVGATLVYIPSVLELSGVRIDLFVHTIREYRSNRTISSIGARA